MAISFKAANSSDQLSPIKEKRRLRSDTRENFLDETCAETSLHSPIAVIPEAATSEKTEQEVTVVTNLNNMEAEIKEIRKLGRQLQRRMDQFGPDHINSVTLQDVKEEMNQLRDVWEEFDENLDSLFEQYEKDLVENKEELRNLKKDISEYKITISRNPPNKIHGY